MHVSLTSLPATAPWSLRLWSHWVPVALPLPGTAPSRPCLDSWRTKVSALLPEASPHPLVPAAPSAGPVVTVGAFTPETFMSSPAGWALSSGRETCPASTHVVRTQLLREGGGDGGE